MFATLTSKGQLTKVENGACRVLDAMGCHVGNLKWIRGVWKLKAIGYDVSGAVIPGGGPLTDQHNTVFTSIDAWQNNRVLAAPADGRQPATEPGPTVLSGEVPPDHRLSQGHSGDLQPPAADSASAPPPVPFSSIGGPIGAP